MKIQYLGTAAAEGIPAVFCECEVCREAKRRGGKNIRTRSQAVIDNRILIDFPADTYMHYLKYNFPLSQIHTCIVTHSHSDHLYPEDFAMRKDGFSHIPHKEPLTIYSGNDAYKKITKTINESGAVCNDFRSILIMPYEPFYAEGYKITALKATHDLKSSPYIYLIEKDGKTLFYANDTSDFPKETWEFLENYNNKISFVSLDCTEGDNKMNYSGHMNIERCCKVRDKLFKTCVCGENTIFVLNHFSHNGVHNLYDEFSIIAEKEKFGVTYDGMIVEF